MFTRRLLPDDPLTDAQTETSGSMFGAFLTMLTRLAPAEFWFVETEPPPASRPHNQARGTHERQLEKR